MEALRIDICLKGTEEFRIYSTGDFQDGDFASNTEAIKKCLDRCRNDPNGYLMIMGDIQNFMRPKVRGRIEAILADDPNSRDEFDQNILKTVDDCIKKFNLDDPNLKKIGFLEGHHYANSRLGLFTTTQYMCSKVKAQYLGFFCWVQIIVEQKFPGGNRSGYVLNVGATHGCGGGKSSMTTAIRKMEETIKNWDVNILLRGHSNDLEGGFTNPIMRATTRTNSPLHIYPSPRLIVNCGGYTQGYQIGKTHYSELGQMSPQQIGYVIVHVKIEKHPHSKEGRKSAYLTYWPEPIPL